MPRPTFHRHVAAAALVVLLAGAAGAADPAFDKALRDALMDVHNKGADLYNQGKDYPGAYRMYEGALRTARPLLAHRPTSQKVIDDGLAAGAKEADPARKAFALHEAIEKVRADLKDAPKVTPEPKKTEAPKKTPEPAPEPKKTEETKKAPEPKAATPEPKKTAEPPSPTKKTEEPPAKSANPPAAGAKGVSGRVVYQGKPVADADVRFVSLDRTAPAIVAAKTNAEGMYTAAGIAPGRYVVTVAATANGKAVLPARYATTDTSGLVVTVAAGASTFDLDLR